MICDDFAARLGGNYGVSNWPDTNEHLADFNKRVTKWFAAWEFHMALTPSLSSVSPTSIPSDSINHTIQLFGSNFVSGDTLLLTDPQGQPQPDFNTPRFVATTEIDDQFWGAAGAAIHELSQV